MKCTLCRHDVEPWPGGGGGFGHNPAPLTDKGRACNWCNENIIIPLRLRMAGVL